MSFKVGNEIKRPRIFCFRHNKVFGQVCVEGEVRLLMFLWKLIFIPWLLSILVCKLKISIVTEASVCKFRF